MIDPVLPERRDIFRRPDLQAQFARDGFLRIPFLAPAEVGQLRAVWESLGPPAVEGIYSNVHDRSPAENHRVLDAIRATFATRVEELFVDCSLAGGTFIVKGCGPHSHSEPHQDWNNVDERRGWSLNIWCPLEDVDERNGALQVIAGSHRLLPTIRGATSPSLYLAFDDELDRYLTPVPAPAGEAVLYAHNVFHGSKANLTTTPRLAVVAGILPDELEHLHYWHPPGAPDGEVQVLGVDDTFFCEELPELLGGRVPARIEERDRIQGIAGPPSRTELLSLLNPSQPRPRRPPPRPR